MLSSREHLGPKCESLGCLPRLDGVSWQGVHKRQKNKNNFREKMLIQLHANFIILQKIYLFLPLQAAG